MAALADPYAIVAQTTSVEGDGPPIALGRQSIPREVFLMLEETRV